MLDGRLTSLTRRSLDDMLYGKDITRCRIRFTQNDFSDFRQLLHDLEYELCNIPRLVFKDILRKELQSLDEEQKTLEKDYKTQEQQWEFLKVKL